MVAAQIEDVFGVAMKSWVDFWNAEHSIYVNDRHKRLHAAAIARDILRAIGDLEAAGLEGRAGATEPPRCIVLDYGCGEALYAVDVARRCRQLILCDAASRTCELLARRLADEANVRVVEPVGAERLPDASLDLIVVNSLLQYLSRDDLDALLDLWRAKLKPAGRLVIADVIPPNVSSLRDAMSLMMFSARGGFVLAALGGLVRTALSDYGRIRKQLGFSTYGEAAFVELLASHGLKCARSRPNFGHNQARMTFVATRA